MYHRVSREVKLRAVNGRQLGLRSANRASRVFSFVRGDLGRGIRGPNADTICTRPRSLWSVTLLSLRKNVIRLRPRVKRISAAKVASLWLLENVALGFGITGGAGEVLPARRRV